MKIYIAGPLFTDGERNFNASLAKLIREKTHDVFLPQELSIDFDNPTWQRDTFRENVRHIDNSRLVIAVLDGAICDDGTSWEIGYAYANYKYIIGLRTDFRQAGPEGIVNLMLGESVNEICKSYQEVLDAVDNYVKQMGDKKPLADIFDNLIHN